MFYSPLGFPIKQQEKDQCFFQVSNAGEGIPQHHTLHEVGFLAGHESSHWGAQGPTEDDNLRGILWPRRIQVLSSSHVFWVQQKYQ